MPLDNVFAKEWNIFYLLEEAKDGTQTCHLFLKIGTVPAFYHKYTTKVANSNIPGILSTVISNLYHSKQENSEFDKVERQVIRHSPKADLPHPFSLIHCNGLQSFLIGILMEVWGLRFLGVPRETQLNYRIIPNKREVSRGTPSLLPFFVDTKYEKAKSDKAQKEFFDLIGYYPLESIDLTLQYINELFDNTVLAERKKKTNIEPGKRDVDALYVNFAEKQINKLKGLYYQYSEEQEYLREEKELLTNNINQVIAHLENKIKDQIPKTDISSAREKSDFNCNLTDDQLTSLYEWLVSRECIAEETTALEDFKAIFSGKTFSKPITWLLTHGGKPNKSVLRDVLEAAYKKGWQINELPTDIPWKTIAKKYFVDVNGYSIQLPKRNEHSQFIREIEEALRT